MSRKSKNQSSIDIAKIAGVSQATVSRVLSGSPKVKSTTRDKVLRVMDDAGFRPNPFARAMRTQHSGTVGVAVSRITNPIVPEILEQLAVNISRKGRRMVVWNTDIEGEDGLIDAIRSRIFDGIIFTAASTQLKAMEATLDSHMPVVSINRASTSGACDQIVSTNKKGGRELACYLVACGRKNIAFVNGPLDRTTLTDREAGFREGLTELGRSIQDDLYKQREFLKNAFRQVAMDLVSLKTPPDAIACGNDLIAIQVLNGLKAAGCRVPEDIWVTGFDDIEMASWDVVSLTTMRQPLELMAADAVDAIIARIEGTSHSLRKIDYNTELIIRHSTAYSRPSI